MITNFFLLILGMVIGGLGGAAIAQVLFEKRRKTNESLLTAAQQQMQHAQRLSQDALTRQQWCDAEQHKLSQLRQEFERRAVSYQELMGENSVLKRDMRNLDIHLRKLRLDEAARGRHQEQLNSQINELCVAYLKDNVRWIGSSLNQNNFANCKQRLTTVIGRCREMGFLISASDETGYVDDLRKEYERVVRVALEREEQARIKAVIREEQAREREIERELKQLERESDAIKVALERALAKAQNEHTEEVQRLEEKLAEAEERAKRTMSQAQLTKAGHVYVISNLGSFGENVFKIGMTRRLQPLDRVTELGDASVPFPFDVHMMISSNDAPSLENAIHRALHKTRLNKANPKKEFFRATIQEIVSIVVANHGAVDYVVDAEALQFRQSVNMSDEDQEFIEHVYDEAEDEGATTDA